MIGALIAPFIIGGGVAFVLNIPVRALEQRIFGDRQDRPRWQRGCSILIVLFVMLAAVAIIIWLTGTELAKASQQLPGARQRMNEWLVRFPEEHSWAQTLAEKVDLEQLVQSARGLVQERLDDWAGALAVLAGNAGRGVIRAGTGVVFAVYVLLQKERLERQVLFVAGAFLAEETLQRIRKICRLADEIFTAYITGQGKEAVVLGAIFIIVLLLCQFPYAVLIGLVIGLASFVPIVGSFVGASLGVVLIALERPASVLWFVLIFLAIQQLESNLIYPAVVGRSVGLPSIWVLAAITTGGTLGGITGIFLSVPICAFLYSCLRESVYRRTEKNE